MIKHTYDLRKCRERGLMVLGVANFVEIDMRLPLGGTYYDARDQAFTRALAENYLRHCCEASVRRHTCLTILLWHLNGRGDFAYVDGLIKRSAAIAARFGVGGDVCLDKCRSAEDKVLRLSLRQCCTVERTKD